MAISLLKPEKRCTTDPSAKIPASNIIAECSDNDRYAKESCIFGNSCRHNTIRLYLQAKTADGHSYVIPIAGKTGTTENWADAWTIGSSPYYTTAVWLGFDRPGNSLGVSQTGATLAAPVWANYMRDIHLGLQYKNFPKPDSGLISATVCSLSGQLPN